MRGGTYNVKYGRNPEVVRDEVIDIMGEADLDWLALQETNDYYDILKDLPGLHTYTGHSVNIGAQREVAIVVKSKHEVTRLSSKAFGDGWMGQGFRMRPRCFLKLVINEKHSVATTHLPPKTNLKTHTPSDRYDDYVALAKRARNYLSGFSRFTRTLAMDANTWPSNENLYSPAWIAEETGAKLLSPDNKLDYFLTKGLVVPSVTKLRNFPENSDHDPVVMLGLLRSKGI